MARHVSWDTSFDSHNRSFGMLGNCRRKLDGLKKWTRREIAKIPRDQRHLATAHAAFHYFCKDWGFTPHPVQGLSREQMPSPKALADLMADLKANQVTAIFPEKESNPKILTTLTNDTGIHLGEPLIADGAGGTGYVEMMRHNVSAIVRRLKNRHPTSISVAYSKGRSSSCRHWPAASV